MLARQWHHDSIDEQLIGVITFGCKSKKAQDKLQMPIKIMLEECLLICQHYESLQWHINTIRPTGGEIEAMDGLARHCPRPKNVKRPTSTVQPDKSKKDCTACEILHQAGECPASSQVCQKYNTQGHYAKLCCSIRNQSVISALTSYRNTRGSWPGRGRSSRGQDPNVLCMKLKPVMLQNL